MRLVLIVLLGLPIPSLTLAQEQRWQQLPGAARSYRVDLQSLTSSGGVLQARVQTSDLGSVVMVQELEIRCKREEARTLARLSYDNDTGRLLTTSERQETDTLWISYSPGSEGHALLAGLCSLARDRKLLGAGANEALGMRSLVATPAAISRCTSSRTRLERCTTC
jgi:hypothetical protein